MRVVRTAIAISTAAVLSAGLTMAGTAQAATDAPVAVRRPATELGFGIQAGLDAKGLGGWTARAGVPWSYAYRYVGGTAGTTKSWTNLAPNATMPITYARTATSQGSVPVFTYYQMLAGTAACLGCGEAQQDLTNLNSPAAMKAYFSDFALLMRRLGAGSYDGVQGFGGDAVVQVEPDLSGYANLAALGMTSCLSFCTGVGNSPSLVKASVASSGFSQAAAYPNTYTGFNEVLLKLRDTYAPNVRLGIHVSNWTTGYDLNSSTSPLLDPVALGRQAAAFANASGATYTNGTHSTYDLVFNDVSNKDAGYYTYVLNKPRFWDQDNTVFPNFRRWESYLGTVTKLTGKQAILWQVPIGNQIYASQNNTAGHWQDNRVEYLFNHPQELKDTGIAGVLFGTTIADATNYADWAGDGVTNPAPICSSNGWSSGKVVCSSTQTPASDDDGGYLRVRAKAYYLAPLSLS